jgi:SAM-dependent methyltransferase
MGERYFIKEGYQPNQQAVSIPGDEGTPYWTPARLQQATTNKYQWYVYELCRDLLRRGGYKSLLDVGSGPPVKVKQLLAHHCEEIVLIDRPCLAQLAQQILPVAKFLPADLEESNIDLSSQFDLIVCADVLEHLMNPDNCVRFVKHHLSGKGLAIFSTPERDYLRGKDCCSGPKPEHVREWNGAEFAQYLDSHGFRLLEHLYFPQMIIPRVEFHCSRVLSRFIKNRRWSSCQVVLCR